jgi:hypothetical protein
MPHDDFENERDRIEHVLDILERTAERLEARKHVPLTMLRDTVTFLRRTEDAAYEAAQMDDGERALSACVDQHTAAMLSLSAMQDALGALEIGVASAAVRFAHAAQDYVGLRRRHQQQDDRLFARASARRRPRSRSIGEPVETADTRHLYRRLVEHAAFLDLGAPTAFPAARNSRAAGK